MKYLILILPVLFLASCGTKTGVVNNTYSTAEPGTIKGKLTLHDTISDPVFGDIINDASGVKVSLEGTSYSAVTNTTGEWELQNIPAGSYPSLVFQKQGFGMQKTNQSSGSYLVGGGGTQYEGEDMFRISRVTSNIVLRGFLDYTLTNVHDTVINQTPHYVYDTITIPQGITTFTSRILDNMKGREYNYYGTLYFGRQAAIDPLDPKTFVMTTFQTGDLHQTDIITGTVDFSVTKTMLQQAGFKSGETIYCASFFGKYTAVYSRFYDPSTGSIIYSGFSPNHSEVRSFVLP